MEGLFCFPGRGEHERDHRQAGTGLPRVEAQRLPVLRDRARHLSLPARRLLHRVPHPRAAGKRF